MYRFILPIGDDSHDGHGLCDRYVIVSNKPAGQDDIGGGCGQLWYFQEWLKRNKV